MINENGVEITRADELVGIGAHMLDLHFDGPQWRRNIDTARLDISDLELCVLGQLFGSYGEGLEALRLRVGVHTGFSSPDDELVDDDKLLASWINYINA